MNIKYQIIGCWERGCACFSCSRNWWLYPDDWDPEVYTFDTLDDAKDAFVSAVGAQDHFITNAHIIALLED